jgi:hypothetical protein
MAHLETARSVAAAPERGGVGVSLYKTDHPRPIDRHIDFFGGGAPRDDVATDRGGEPIPGSRACSGGGR